MREAQLEFGLVTLGRRVVETEFGIEVVGDRKIGRVLTMATFEKIEFVEKMAEERVVGEGRRIGD